MSAVAMKADPSGLGAEIETLEQRLETSTQDRRIWFGAVTVAAIRHLRAGH